MHNMHAGTTFYSTLCKLLFSDETSLKFKTFVAPFTTLLAQVMPPSRAPCLWVMSPRHHCSSRWCAPPSRS